MIQSSRMALEVHARRQRVLTMGLLLAGLGLAGCRKDGALPQHYEDPQAMIQVFEKAERDDWQMPDRVVRALPLADQEAVVADIGAGSGYFTRRLAMRVPKGRVYAVDVDGEFEDYLLRNREAWGTPHIEPHLAHYDDPMLPANELDLVFSANTYAFIRDRIGYFRKIHTALQPGGHLAVLDFRPDAKAPPEVAPAPEHRVAKERAIEELRQAGFEVVGDETFLPYQWFLILKANK